MRCNHKIGVLAAASCSLPCAATPSNIAFVGVFHIAPSTSPLARALATASFTETTIAPLASTPAPAASIALSATTSITKETPATPRTATPLEVFRACPRRPWLLHRAQLQLSSQLQPLPQMG